MPDGILKICSACTVMKMPAILEVRQRLEIFSQSGGYVFNTIHNIVGNTPIENLQAMFEVFQEFNGTKA